MAKTFAIYLFIYLFCVQFIFYNKTQWLQQTKHEPAMAEHCILLICLNYYERHGGIKHDDFTWNDIMNTHTQTHTHLKMEFTASVQNKS